MGMPKNNRGAATPYPLKMANIRKRGHNIPEMTHTDMAIAIFFLAAKRLFGFCFFFAAAGLFLREPSPLDTDGSDALPATVRVGAELFRREPLIVRMSDVPHFRMITLEDTIVSM